MNKHQHLNDIRNHIYDLLKQYDIYKMEIFSYGEKDKAMTEINCFAIDDENPVLCADYIIDGDGISLREIINGWLYEFLSMYMSINRNSKQNYTGFLDMEPFTTGSAVFVENYKLPNQEVFKASSQNIKSAA